MVDGNQQIAQRIQEKYDFYIVGLIFTVLALSVQSANFGSFADAFELAAWACLLTSGLLGLERIKSLPLVFQIFNISDRVKADKNRIEQAEGNRTPVLNTNGDQISVPKEAEKLDHCIAELNADVSKRRKRIQLYYKMHHCFFIAGMSMLMLSRAYDPLVRYGSNIFNIIEVLISSNTHVSS